MIKIADKSEGVIVYGILKERINEKANREPMGYSFGSTFKNSSIPAWKCVKSVVDSLRECRGVRYSQKHFNWIINKSASGEDIYHLLKDTQKNVKDKLDLELEV